MSDAVRKRGTKPTAPTVPSVQSWSKPWVHPTTRAEEARATRQHVPRTSHAAFEPQPKRDPISILASQEADRLQELLPLRHQRMAESAFAYYRGTPAVMAFDLANAPRTNMAVQASGDAHLSNFGLYASPERTLVFDANDFDETLPGPWEWDVKRLAASVVIAGRGNGFSAATNRQAAMATVRGYREWMGRYAGMRLVEVLYARITDADFIAAVEASGVMAGAGSAQRRKALAGFFAKARQRDGLKAFDSLTGMVDGRRMILDDPPVLTHVSFDDSLDLEAVFADYRSSMPESQRGFLERYGLLDVALKVVGVGSVGTRCLIVALQGRDEGDGLILQVKEATASVLEPHLETATYETHGQRVVVGQQLMQANSDIFLGWTRVPGGRDFYFRQLWDMKGSVDTTILRPAGLAVYGGICGWALARSHARTGDAVGIAAYLGRSDTFDGAIADFAETYADVNAVDHATYVRAVESGDITTAGSTTEGPIALTVQPPSDPRPATGKRDA